MNPITVAKWLGALAIVAAIFFGGRSCGTRAGAIDVANLKADHAKVLARLSDATAKASEAARKSEIATAQAFAKAEKQTLERIAHAQESAVADTRSCFATGKCRVRNPWACPSAGLPGPASDPGQPDDSARLREDAIGRVRGIGRIANEYVALCLATLKAERATP